MVVEYICRIQLPSNINLWAITSRERSKTFGNQILAPIYQVINNIVNLYPRRTAWSQNPMSLIHFQLLLHSAFCQDIGQDLQ